MFKLWKRLPPATSRSSSGELVRLLIDHPLTKKPKNQIQIMVMHEWKTDWINKPVGEGVLQLLLLYCFAITIQSRFRIIFIGIDNPVFQLPLPQLVYFVIVLINSLDYTRLLAEIVSYWCIHKP